MLAQPGQRSPADEHRQHAGGAQPELPVRQQADVLDGGVEVCGGLVEVAVVHGAEPVDGLRREQIARREVVLGQHGAGQVAAACAQIGRDVAQDVDQLQALAEAYAGLEQPRLGGVVGLEQVRQRQVCPEFADTTGDAVGIVVKFLLARQRDDRVAGGVGEALEVQRLPAGNCVEHLPDALPVAIGKLLEIADRRGGILEQLRLGGIALEPGEDREVGQRAGAALDALVELPKYEQALVGGATFRVGDGVGDTGEEIAQADLRSDARRQRLEGQVKGAGGFPEQRVDGLVDQLGHDSRAGAAGLTGKQPVAADAH